MFSYFPFLRSTFKLCVQSLAVSEAEVIEARAAGTDAERRTSVLSAEAAALRARVEEYERMLAGHGLVDGLVEEVSRLQVRVDLLYRNITCPDTCTLMWWVFPGICFRANDCPPFMRRHMDYSWICGLTDLCLCEASWLLTDQ